VELQDMRVWKYSPDDEQVCAVRYLQKPIFEKTLCGMGIHRIDDIESRCGHYDAIGKAFTGGYGDVTCCNCRDTIDDFVEQATCGKKVELQKMRGPNGEEWVCAVWYTRVECFAEETLCGISYNSDEKVAQWVVDTFGEPLVKRPVPIGRSFYGLYGDITCGECRDVIEYYLKQKIGEA